MVQDCERYAAIPLIEHLIADALLGQEESTPLESTKVLKTKF